jgi:hypothetical protein
MGVVPMEHFDIMKDEPTGKSVSREIKAAVLRKKLDDRRNCAAC